MIHCIFEWREDHELGDEGWIMKGQPDFNASTGLGIAHDTLEHFTGRYGSLTDEMLAFGAMLHVRADGGWFGGSTYNPDPAYHMGSDISNFLEKLRYGADMGDGHYSIEPVRPTRPLKESVEDILQRCIAEGVLQANANFNSDDENGPFARDDDCERMIGWMRLGYRKAVRRYAGSSSFDLTYLFQRVAEKVNKQFANGEFGEELHVRVNPRTLESRIHRDYAAYANDR